MARLPYLAGEVIEGDGGPSEIQRRVETIGHIHGHRVPLGGMVETLPVLQLQRMVVVWRVLVRIHWGTMTCTLITSRKTV
jgi:hypothetical protein